MIYRIDYKHFLMHMIDHYTLDELISFKYLIISAGISNQNRASNVTKMNILYPTPETVMTYTEYHDKKIMEKMYLDTLHPDKSKVGIKEYNEIVNRIYLTFINPLINHHDILIICQESENDYIDVLCKHLKDEYLIEVIDLNQLFTTGKVGELYIDRDKIWDKAVDVRRAAGAERIRELSMTREGKIHLINQMNLKEKIRKLKKYGISTKGIDPKDINNILLEAWCDEDGTNDD